MKEFLVDDLDEVVAKSTPLHDNFRNANIIILGPNGFIGNWLRRSLLHMNKNTDLNIRIKGIVRNSPNPGFRGGNHYQEQTFEAWQDFGDTEVVTHVFHCATKSRGLTSTQSDVENELVRLTTKTIDRVSRRAAPKFIHLSSGAVYGEAARRERLIVLTTPTESYSRLDTYGQVKLNIENLVKEATEKGQILGGNPRLFTFFGPGLELDKEFAISSFVKTAKEGNCVEITGHPATERTYMYPTDLISELLKCADSPSIKPLHLGGGKIFSMNDIAQEVARVWNVTVKLPKEVNSKPNFYNPEVSEIYNPVSLAMGLMRWKSWLSVNS